MSDPTSEIYFIQEQHHQVAGEQSRVYTELAAKFFKSMFEKDYVIESNIRWSLQTETLILILGTKQTLEQVESYIPSIKRKNVLLLVSSAWNASALITKNLLFDERNVTLQLFQCLLCAQNQNFECQFIIYS